MLHNITRNSAYNYSITYEKPQSKLKDWGGTKALVEKNDADNDVYRNAVTKATMIAEDVRYSQGTFDLSMLIGGGNTNSYFTGKLSNARFSGLLSTNSASPDCILSSASFTSFGISPWEKVSL